MDLISRRGGSRSFSSADHSIEINAEAEVHKDGSHPDDLFLGYAGRRRRVSAASARAASPIIRKWWMTLSIGPEPVFHNPVWSAFAFGGGWGNNSCFVIRMPFDSEPSRVMGRVLGSRTVWRRLSVAADMSGPGRKPMVVGSTNRIRDHAAGLRESHPSQIRRSGSCLAECDSLKCERPEVKG
jgi:hypothetical protein